MNKIDACFQGLRARKEPALIPFVTGGDPDLETTVRLAEAFAEQGADLLEIGVPFSEPLADGTTIQRASERALKAGVTLGAILRMVEQLRERSEIPVVLMSYYNPIFCMGVDAFTRRAAAASVDGVIVPDLPPEEGTELTAACADTGLDPIFLAAPTSTPERLACIAAASQGYIYYVSLKGVTGARERLADDLAKALTRLRQITDKPVAVGFGIATPGQAREVGRVADGVIVGSAIVSRIEEGLGSADMPGRVAAFVGELKRAIVPQNGNPGGAR